MFTEGFSSAGTSPRMRGKPPDLLKSTLLSGTSPRMRGKRKKIQTELTLGRNIPAYAGKTVQDAAIENVF